MPYHVLMNSRAYGTEAFPCATLEQAVEKLSRLAKYADEDRRNDGIQRFFCIVDAATAAQMETPSDTLVIFLESGCIRWIASDLSQPRVFILDANGERGKDTPTACWEEKPRSLAEIDANLLSVLRAQGANCGGHSQQEERS